MKKELRQRLRKVLASIDPEELRTRSAEACHLLEEQPEFHRAEVVMLFFSLTAEIDTTPLILRAWQDRKRVLAPKVSWEQRRMLPIEVTSAADIHEVRMGIREPIRGVPFPVGEIDLVILPGLAFDHVGNRLGRGKGFYDRFLAHKDYRAVSCALAIEEQIVDSVPVGPHDMPIDMLVTDKEVRRFGR
ncbi:MAG: 5-formyltetrahydrofolate cyclo-ligase [Phycisphaerae bacterium]|nr:5-formyltetrahydrofolate cyclo-ligase [Phycisphaerae bacterium]